MTALFGSQFVQFARIGGHVWPNFLRPFSYLGRLLYFMLLVPHLNVLFLNIILETACLRMAFECFNLDFFLEKCFNTFLISIFLGIPGSFH